MKKKTRVEAPLPSSNGSNVAAVVEEGHFSNGGTVVSKKKMKTMISPSKSEAAASMDVDVEASANGEAHLKKNRHAKKRNPEDIDVSGNGSLGGIVVEKPAVKVGKGQKGNKRKGPKLKGDETPALPSTISGESSVATLKAINLSVKEGAASEPIGMQIYWNLSSIEAKVREVASLALVKELTAAQKDYEERGLGKEERDAEAVILGEDKVEEDGLHGCSPAVQYALRRLVRGVASSRESSRQGFALAFAAVIGTVPCIRGAAVVKLIEKNLEISASMKGPEMKDALLGQLFAYGAIVRSARLFGVADTPEQQELVKEVTQHLLLLAKKKTFLREPATYLVAELGEQLGARGMEKGLCAAPLFSAFMRDGSDSPDTLLLAIRLHKKLPTSLRGSCPLIPASGNFDDLLEPNNLSRLVPCLQESSCSHPRIHSIWHSLLDLLFTQVSGEDETSRSSKKAKKKRGFDNESSLEVKIASFWNIVVEAALITSSHERKQLAMHLALLFLQRLPSLTYTKYILTRSFLTCLLDSTASKDNLLFKGAQQCIGDICKWAESNEERRIQLILAFQSFSHGQFDKLTKTQSVKTLLTGLTTISSYQKLFKALVDVNNVAVGIDECAELSVVGAGYKKQKTPAEEIVDGEGSDSEKEKDIAGRRRWVMELLRVLPQQAWAKLPVSVVVEELVMEFIPSLTPVLPLSEDERESVDKLQSTLQHLSAALTQVESGDQKERLQAMVAIIVQLLYEALFSPKVAVETATEISIICKKAFGDLVELDVESDVEEESEAPAFMDVLVDVLLSLLAESSAAVRSAAEQVFKAFSGDLTSSGLADMLRIVKKNSKAGRHKPLIEVDDANDDDEDIVAVEDSEDDMSEDEDDNDVGSGESDDDQEDAEAPRKDEAVVSGDRRGADSLKSEDDGEESEASDLDDEAMFKFDKHLAQILKQRKHGGGSDGTDDPKDAHTQLLHFKFRVLALLEFFVQKQSDSLLVLTILPSLLHVFVNSCTAEGDSQVADRVSSILLQKLFKGKHYPKSSQVDQSALKDLLRKALKLASRSTIKRVCAVAENCTYWLLKVILGNCEKEQEKEVEAILLLALDDFFEHKKCKLSSEFFRQCCTRFPSLGNCLLGSLLDKCVSARSEHLQLEARRLAGAILGLSAKNAKKSKLLSAEEAKVRAEFLKPHLGSLSAIVLSLLKNLPTKASKRAEVVQFCVSVVELHRNLFPEKSLSEFLNSDDTAAAIEALNPSALPKGRFNNLVNKLQQLLGPKN